MTKKIIALLTPLWLSLGGLTFAQTGGVRGTVADTSGAAVPGAQVTISSDAGVSKLVTTSDSGSYLVDGLLPGQYTVRASFPGMESQPSTVEVSDGIATLDITLRLVLEMGTLAMETSRRGLRSPQGQH